MDSIRTTTLRALLLAFICPLLPALAGWQVGAAEIIQTFPVGRKPWGITYDGASIWVANSRDDTVTKLRASDGALEGTFPVGGSPYYMTFDGANIWVTNYFDNTVTKLRASDGTTLGTFAVGNGPFHLAFDGASIWIVNSGADSVTKLRASDGTVEGTFTVGGNPIGVAFDGVHIWVSVANENKLKKLRPSDGAIVYDKLITVPQDLLVTGASLWIAQPIYSQVNVMHIKGAHLYGTWALDGVPFDMAFDGRTVWASCPAANKIDGLRPPNGIVQSINVNYPLGLAYDGANIWAANYKRGTVSKISTDQ